MKALADLQTGDEVIRVRGLRGSCPKYTIEKVKKATEKRLIVGVLETVFDRSGHTVYKRDNHYCLVEPTETNLALLDEQEKDKRELAARNAELDARRREREDAKFEEVARMIRMASSDAEAVLILKDKVWELTN